MSRFWADAEGKREKSRQVNSKVGPGEVNNLVCWCGRIDMIRKNTCHRAECLGFKVYHWTWPAQQLGPTEPQLPHCKCRWWSSSCSNREDSMRWCVCHPDGSNSLSMLWVPHFMSGGSSVVTPRFLRVSSGLNDHHLFPVSESPSPNSYLPCHD